MTSLSESQTRMVAEHQRFKVVNDALVLPTLVNPGGRLAMGVFTARGDFVEESLLTRSGTLLSSPGELETEQATVNHTGIFAGPLLNHYGHFILEALGRLSITALHPELPIVWSCRVLPNLNERQLENRSKCLDYQLEILNYLGIRNPIEFVTKPTRYQSLIVPETGYRISDVFKPWHRAFLSRQAYEPESGKKIWLSRARLKRITDVGELNTRVFEQRLQDTGWEIYHPQQDSFATQIKKLASAERIAGFEGSALHNVIFVDDCKSLTVDIVARRRRINPNYINIARAKSFTQHIHHTVERVIVESRGAHVLSCSPKPALTVNSLNHSRGGGTIETGVTDIKESGRDLDKQILRFMEARDSRQVLILGSDKVRYPAISKEVSCVLVNSQFQFDYSQCPHASSHLEIPVESYFYFFKPPAGGHDLIVVFGQTAAQTFQRFLLAHAFHTRPADWILCVEPTTTDSLNGNKASNEVLLEQLMTMAVGENKFAYFSQPDGCCLASVCHLDATIPFTSGVDSKIHKQVAINVFPDLPMNHNESRSDCSFMEWLDSQSVSKEPSALLSPESEILLTP